MSTYVYGIVMVVGACVGGIVTMVAMGIRSEHADTAYMMGIMRGVYSEWVQYTVLSSVGTASGRYVEVAGGKTPYAGIATLRTMAGDCAPGDVLEVYYPSGMMAFKRRDDGLYMTTQYKRIIKL